MFESLTWPAAIVVVAVLLTALFLIAAGLASWHEFRKLKVTAAQEESLRQLVGRYEKLAEGCLDTQQRAAADLAELRTRTASIEQILRTVE